VTAAIRAELRKLFTTRLWWGLAIGVALSAAFITALFTGLAGNQGLPELDAPNAVSQAYTSGLTFAYIIVLALGIISIGSEYRHQTISSAYLTVPHRARLFGAKLVASAVMGAVYGVVYVVAALATGIPIILFKGFDPFPADDTVVRSLGMSVIALVLWALIGFGLGALIKNQIAALLVGVGVAFIGEQLILLGLVALDWGAVGAYLPGMATVALVQEPLQVEGSPFAFEYLEWWQAILVLSAYALVLAGLGAFRASREDVS
jgi:ABC-2 type transport system permease protein